MRYLDKIVTSRTTSVAFPLFIGGGLLSMCLLMSACNGHFGRRPPLGKWITILSGDSVSKLAKRHRVPISDIVEINGLNDPSRILVGQRLFIPQLNRRSSPDRLIDLQQEQNPLETNGDRLSELPGFRLLHGAPISVIKKFQWPIIPNLHKNTGLSSPFGLRNGRPHKGLDISASMGTEVRAALSGEVIRSEYSQGGYGWVIYIKHSGGLETRYAHHQKNMVKKGRFVNAGETIATVGNSGKSSGPHLHFELRISGEAVDPLLYLPALSPAQSKAQPSNTHPQTVTSLSSYWQKD